MDLDAWTKWLEICGLRPRTITEYVKIARKSIAAGDPLAEALREDVSDQYREVAKAAARRLVEWARPAALAALSARAKAIRHGRQPHHVPPPPISDAEWARLKESVKGLVEPFRSILQLMMASGMRIGDALGISRAAILAAQHDKAGAIDVVMKGGRTIRLPYEPLRKPLERLLARPGWQECWQLLGETKVGAEECLRRALRRAARSASITRRMYPHLLRHTVAYHLIEKTRDLHLVSKLLGHSSTETTQLYTWYRSLSSMKQALDDPDTKK
jgi:site-specific recombinase XerD